MQYTKRIVIQDVISLALTTVNTLKCRQGQSLINTAGSPMVGCPINLVQELIDYVSLIKDPMMWLASVDL